MVKKGPCFHCGIDSTPLWRNGPPEKPVLCNACGSRFRLWASLDNYTPRHAQLQSLGDLKNMNTTASNINNKHKFPSRTKNFTLGSIISPEGKLNPSLWNSSPVPSKKRSPMVYRKLTPMQRFRKQILSWWKQERKKKESREDVLIMHKVNSLMVPSNEIGLGGMLLQPDHHV